MAKFEIEKNGYNKKQVDEYIFKLTNDCEDKMHNQVMRINDLKKDLDKAESELSKYKQKNESISDALLVAVETAKQIENGSKNIYDLEINRIRSLYDKWKKILDDLVRIHPTLKDKYDTKELLQAFSNDIDKILKQNKKSIEQKQVVAVENFDTAVPDTIGIRLLINKMSGKNINNHKQVIKRQNASQESIERYKEEQSTKDNATKMAKDQIKAISDLKIDKNDKFENVVDKFLMSDEEDYQNSAYSKILFEKQKNEKFDLKEAVTPTEDLSEIMKAFSFYPENEQKKKSSSKK